MDSLQASRIVGGNTNYKRNASDFYPTPPEVTQALLDFLNLPPYTLIWEPACGDGHMVKVMEANGYAVISSDIKTGKDFLIEPFVHSDWIITNPPFSLADKFIERCAYHKVSFALLLKSQYWHAKKRYQIFKKYQPSYVLPLTWRPYFLFKQRGSGSPLMDVMWCVWLDNSINNRTEYFPLLKPIENKTAFNKNIVAFDKK